LGLPAVKISIDNRLLPIHLPKAAQALKQQHIDLIHCHGYKAFVFAFVIGRLMRLPVLSTCHLWFLQGHPPLKMRVMIKLELLLYRFCPRVISVSQPIKSFLMGAGVPPARIHIIPNGLRLEDYHADDPSAVVRLKTALGIDRDDKVILNVGRLTLQKAQRTILEAAALLRDANQKFRFLIVGDGELRGALQAAIRDMQLAHCVTLLGFRRDIGALLSLADLFVLTSLDEGMPMSLLEAVASRTPVITTAVGDIPKLIIHRKSGWIIPAEAPQALADAVTRLSAAQPEASALAARALEGLRCGYSSRTMFHQYRGIYRELSHSYLN
jgi:glycosyltransferase involved in cell wall biosynthesis